MHVSKAVLLTTTALTLTTALPSSHTTNSNPPHQNPDRARAQQLREQRLAAFAAQKPLHTSALLAGAAAATPTAQKRRNNMRVRDLRTVTGEDGLWVNLEDIVAREGDGESTLDEGQEEEDDDDERDNRGVYKKKVHEQVVFIERREGWDGKRKGKGKGKGNGAGEI